MTWFSAMSATIIGTSRRTRPTEHVDRLIQIGDIALTVPEVDAIVLTLPGTAATEKLIGTDVLAAVKPGTILVNGKIPHRSIMSFCSTTMTTRTST